VISSKEIHAFLIFSNNISKLFALSLCIHTKAGALSLLDFFKYSNLVISSLSEKKFKNSFNAHGL